MAPSGIVGTADDGNPPLFGNVRRQRAARDSIGAPRAVIASFVVDTTGLADVGSLKVIRSSHQLFVTSIVAAMPDMRFTPAMVGGRKVKQLVMQPFVFQIADSAKAASKLVLRHDSNGAAWSLVPIYGSTRALWKMVPSVVRPPQSR